MKNLLIITQKVDENDDVLGFFTEWIRKLALKAEKVSVICLFEGKHNLPSNVRVFSLGKEKEKSKLKYLIKFYKYIWQLRENYDSVFVHMNPRYVVLGGPFWKLSHKRIVLWYAHGHVNKMLRLADKITDVAVASTPEGYRVSSSKIEVIGQGIDVNKFTPLKRVGGDHYFKIVTVGRITMSKDYETLIRAAEKLKSDGRVFEIEIAGQPATERDILYLEDLKRMIEDKKMTSTFKFIGPVANKNLPPFLQSADLFVNMSHTGSLDKAILEAMACGLPILTCNEALEGVLGHYKDVLMYPKKDFLTLAGKINSIESMSSEERARLSSALREIVIKNHNLDGFIDRLSRILLEK